MSLIEYVSESMKEKLRTLDPDSAAYQTLGRKCVFCRATIVKQDTVWPHWVMESAQGHVAHNDCWNYVMEKYPEVPIKDLEGKIIRQRSIDFRKRVLGF